MNTRGSVDVSVGLYVSCSRFKVDRTQATREGGSTVVIRNLPPKICSSSEMADWLKDSSRRG
eukprot:5659063-Amphidinium_carterae.2